MTKPFSETFKNKMVQRLTGRNAISALQLGRETGLRQQTLSHWLRQARSVPEMARRKNPPAQRTVEEKARLLTAAAKLDGEQLTVLLEREGLMLAEIEQWRLALDEDGRSSKAVTNRIRALERELARKEKALAEAAALLILKKKLHDAFGGEDDDTDEGNEK